MASRRLQVVLDLDTGSYSGRMTTAASQTRAFSGVVNSSSTSVRRLGTSFNNLNSQMSTPLQKLRDYVLILGNIRLAILNVRDIAVGWVGSLIQQSAQVERLTILMRGLSDASTEAGRNKQANENLRMLFDTARKTGFAVDALADSFVKMSAGGIDPTKGALTSLTDAVAYFGGTSDTMHRASIAIQQMSGKGVISMEELRQQLGEAVPTAMKDMARAAGMEMKQFVDLVSKGAVQAKPALELMFREFELLYAGAGQRMANTLTGQMAQFRTNVTELATYFTGLASGTTAEWDAYVAEQQKLLEANKITIEEFDRLTAKDDTLFSGATDALKEINAAMRSAEGRQFVIDIGVAVNSVLKGMMAVGGFIVKWRDEITVALKVIVASFLAVKAVNIFQWMAQGAGVAMIAVRNLGSGTAQSAGVIQGAFAGMQAKANDVSNAYQRLGAMQQLRAQRTAVELSQAGQKVAALTSETQHLRRLGQDYSKNAVIIDRHRKASEAALVAGRASGRYRDYETGTFISQNRAIEINKNLVAAGTRNRVAAAQNARALATAEGSLTAAVSAQTAAVSRNVVATTAQTTAQRIATVATKAGAMAARGLAVAVSLALGPLGLIATALFFAADAAGVFENKANSAAAAASRLMQGIADLEAMKTLQDRGDDLRSRKERIQGQLENGHSYANTRAGQIAVPLRGDEKAELQRQLKAIDDELATHAKALKRGATAIGIAGADELAQGALFERDRRRAESQAAYQEYLRKNPNDTAGANRAADQAHARNDSYDTEFIKSLEAKRDAVTNGDQRLILDRVISQYRQAAGMSDELAESSESLRQGIQGVGKESGKTSKKLTDAEKAMRAEARAAASARERYADMIANQAGEIAELKADAEGAETALAKFNAQLNAGMFKDATAEEIANLRMNFAEIDRLTSERDWGRSLRQLRREVVQTTAEANGLWRALAADNTGRAFEDHQRVENVRSRFADKIEQAAGDPQRLAEVNAEIDQMIANLNRIDAASATDNWRRMTEEIQTSLLDENEARQRNFDLEVERQQRLLDLVAQGTDERRMAEERFYSWKASAQAKLERDSESSIIRQARDWAQLGSNIQGSLAGALSSFVDGMGDAEFNFADFSVSIMKELVKIILKAMVAYAILSAIGMANNSSGQAVSMGSFLKGQMAGGLGGTADASRNIGFTTAGAQAPVSAPTAHIGGVIGRLQQSANVDPAVFKSARSYHTGTNNIGGRALRPGEVPMIGKVGEVVLTEEHQAMLGKRLRGEGSAIPANIQVNVINNSGQDLTADQGEPEFNGRDMIVSVVVEAAQKEGPLRDVLSGFGKQ